MNHFFIALKQFGQLLLLPVFLSACDTPQQMYWDSKVKAMCEKDGGVTVFERVELSKVKYPQLNYAQNGEVILPINRRTSKHDPFYLKAKTDFLKEGYLKIVRYENSIIRTKDQKTLSTYVSYGRGGGDIPTISYPSSFSCDEIEGFESNFSKLTFIYNDQ
jgi:hypothetical protein